MRAALQGTRELYPDKRIVVVFQPHLFSRTKLLLNEFAMAFSDADEVILAPIFPAREVFDPTISSDILAEKINSTSPASRLSTSPHLMRGGDSVPSLPLVKGRVGVRLCSSFKTFSDIETYLKSSLGPNDLLITMGAGEQYKIGEDLLV